VGGNFVSLDASTNTVICIAHKRLKMLPYDAFWEPKMRLRPRLCSVPCCRGELTALLRLPSCFLKKGKKWEWKRRGRKKVGRERETGGGVGATSTRFLPGVEGGWTPVNGWEKRRESWCSVDFFCSHLPLRSPEQKPWTFFTLAIMSLSTMLDELN